MFDRGKTITTRWDSVIHLKQDRRIHLVELAPIGTKAYFEDVFARLSLDEVVYLHDQYCTTGNGESKDYETILRAYDVQLAAELEKMSRNGAPLFLLSQNEYDAFLKKWKQVPISMREQKAGRARMKNLVETCRVALGIRDQFAIRAHAQVIHDGGFPVLEKSNYEGIRKAIISEPARRIGLVVKPSCADGIEKMLYHDHYRCESSEKLDILRTA